MEVTISNVAFTIGSFEVYWYGILIGLALLIGLVFCTINAKRFGVDSDRMLDVIIIGAVLAVICGRLYYIFFSGDSFPTFLDWIDLRGGGIAMYGVLFGAFLGAFIGCKLRKVPVLPMFDMAGISFMMASCIGRWGNFLNQEAFGINTDLPWGMLSTRTVSYLSSMQAELAARGITVDPSLPVHPTFLYESIWTFFGAIFLICYIKRRKFDGQIFLMYTLWYGVARAFIEGLRTDSLYIGDLRVSQLVGAVLAVVALVAIIVIRILQKKREGFLPVYAYTERCASDLAAIAAKREENAKKAKSLFAKKKKPDEEAPKDSSEAPSQDEDSAKEPPQGE